MGYTAVGAVYVAVGCSSCMGHVVELGFRICRDRRNTDESTGGDRPRGRANLAFQLG